MRPVVFFDLDGTLVDTVGLIVASFQHACREVLGEEVSDVEARSWIGRPLLPIFLERAPTQAHALDITYREWNLANTEALIAPYAGASELVHALNREGRRMGIVTSKRRRTAEIALESVGLLGHIEIVCAMEDTEEHKPSPGPLLFASHQYGVAPADCVYVGDTTYDVDAASAASMATIAVTWGAGTPMQLAAASPDVTVDSMSQLTQALSWP